MCSEVHGAVKWLQCSKPCCPDVWKARAERRSRRGLGLGFSQAPADLCLAEDPHTHRVQGAPALKSAGSKLLKLVFATASTWQLPKLFQMHKKASQSSIFKTDDQRFVQLFSWSLNFHSIRKYLRDYARGLARKGCGRRSTGGRGFAS